MGIEEIGGKKGLDKNWRKVAICTEIRAKCVAVVFGGRSGVQAVLRGWNSVFSV